jgi:hypothetical protein
MIQMQNGRKLVPGVSHAALLRSHIQILELMAAHCDRLLQQDSGSAYHKIELRRAAADYRELADQHRRFLETVEFPAEPVQVPTAA